MHLLGGFSGALIFNGLPGPIECAHGASCIAHDIFSRQVCRGGEIDEAALQTRPAISAKP
jgi:hypothetical protein